MLSDPVHHVYQPLVLQLCTLPVVNYVSRYVINFVLGFRHFARARYIPTHLCGLYLHFFSRRLERAGRPSIFLVQRFCSWVACLWTADDPPSFFHGNQILFITPTECCVRSMACPQEWLTKMGTEWEFNKSSVRFKNFQN